VFAEEVPLPRGTAVPADLAPPGTAEGRDNAAVRALLAKGLVDTLMGVQSEGDLARTDALLAELRDLAAAWPDEAALRETLAIGLVKTLNAAQAAGDLALRDAMLDQLRGLATTSRAGSDGNPRTAEAGGADASWPGARLGVIRATSAAITDRDIPQHALRFWTASQVADELHIPQHVLRFWETKFPQLRPLRRSGGRRY
jgi:hypothetical protein